jgi:hypothetical protein
LPERAHNAGLTAERLVDGVHRRAGALGDARNRGRRVTLLETSTEIIGGKLAAGGPALLFGHGQNPINFISVCDVAALVEQAIQDPLLRGETIDVPGLDNLTMTQIAQLLGATKIRRIPCGGLRFLSAWRGPSLRRSLAKPPRPSSWTPPTCRGTQPHCRAGSPRSHGT